MSLNHRPFHYIRSFLRLLSLMTRYLQYPSHFFTETRRQKQTYKVAVPRTFIATKQGHMRYAKYLSNPLWIQLSHYSPSTSLSTQSSFFPSSHPIPFSRSTSSSPPSPRLASSSNLYAFTFPIAYCLLSYDIKLTDFQRHFDFRDLHSSLSSPRIDHHSTSTRPQISDRKYHDYQAPWNISQFPSHKLILIQNEH